MNPQPNQCEPGAPGCECAQGDFTLVPHMQGNEPCGPGSFPSDQDMIGYFEELGGVSMDENSPGSSTEAPESELIEEDEELIGDLARHQLLRNLMQEFYSLWSPTFKEVPQRSPGDSTCRTPANASSAPVQGQPNAARNGKRRMEDRDSPLPEGDGNGDRKKQNMGAPNLGPEDLGRRLACPFHKNDPAKYGIANLPHAKYRSCAGPGFRNMTRLR